MSTISGVGKIVEITPRVFRIYGASGKPAGWIERSHLKLCPWRLSLYGKPPEDFRFLRDAKNEAKIQSSSY